jgi:hypothetical protein
MPIADILTVIASIIVIINTVKFLNREGGLHLSKTDKAVANV